jgi:hypothetical protein
MATGNKKIPSPKPSAEKSSSAISKKNTVYDAINLQEEIVERQDGQNTFPHRGIIRLRIINGDLCPPPTLREHW